MRLRGTNQVCDVCFWRAGLRNTISSKKGDHQNRSRFSLELKKQNIMQVQAIDLSEIEILRRFSEMEKHFPRCVKSNFFPSLDFYLNYYENPEKAIKAEADNMFAFVGMGMYITEFKFDNLTNAAGNIQLTPDYKAMITIDNSTAKDAKKVLATLAHELCHKILFNHGLYFKNFLEEENEIYADLATFYVGFGNLTMEGYKVGNSISGYLTPSTYARAFHIIKTFNRDIDYTISTLPDHAKAEIGKAEAESIFSKWLKDFLDTDHLSNIFTAACRNISHAQFMCDMLVNLFQKKSDYYKGLINKISSSFYGYNAKDFEWHKFSISFNYMENVCIEKLQNNGKIIVDEIMRLSSVFHELYEDNYEKEINLLQCTFSCPICGMQIRKELDQKVYHFICPKCKSHVIINTSKDEIIENIKYVEKEKKTRTNTYLEELEFKKEECNRLLKEKQSLLKVIKGYESEIESLKKKPKVKWYKKIWNKL